MITALRGAVYEALKRGDEMHQMYLRFEKEAKDPVIKNFMKVLAEDIKRDMDMMRKLNLHSIVKFGLAIKFHTPQFDVDETAVRVITDKAGAKEILKVSLDELNADIEYYEHIAEHALFPEVKRMFRIVADKELEHKLKIKAFMDLLE